jgi:hypothetical protein
MFAACVTEPTAIPAPGTRLYAETLSESLGEVVQAAATADGHIHLLAVVKLDDKDKEPVHLGNPQGPRVRFVECQGIGSTSLQKTTRGGS